MLRQLAYAVVFFGCIFGAAKSNLNAQGIVYIGTSNFNQYVNGTPGATYNLGDLLESKNKIEIINGTSQTATVTVVSEIDGGMTQTIGPFTVSPNSRHTTTLNRNLTAANATHNIAVDVSVTVPMGLGSSANISHLYTKNP